MMSIKIDGGAVLLATCYQTMLLLLSEWLYNCVSFMAALIVMLSHITVHTIHV